MADNDQDVTQEQPAAQAAPQLPAHLNPAWFAEGAPIPAFMAGNANWMNVGDAGEVIYVRFPDGRVHQTMNGIHLGVWILQNRAVIIPEPKE